MSDTPARAYVRDAVAVMTAWVGEPDVEGPAPADVVAAILMDRHDPHDHDSLLKAQAGLSAGLVSLCGALLSQRFAETGISKEDTLKELALKYA